MYRWVAGAPSLLAPHQGPPVLGSSWLLLLFEENKISSPLGLTAALTPGRVLALNRSTVIIPTMSKTVRIRVNHAECFFLHLKLAL